MGPSGHTAALICTVFEKVEVSMWVSGALVRSRMLAGKNRCRDLLHLSKKTDCCKEGWWKSSPVFKTKQNSATKTMALKVHCRGLSPHPAAPPFPHLGKAVD